LADNKDEEVCTKFLQMNITNWLKSWGRDTDESIDIQNDCLGDHGNQITTKSIRDGLLSEQLSVKK
jgi:hypothetical protein